MQLQINVFSGVNAMSNDNKIFERIVDVHDDLTIPFDSLVKDLKFMFGASCVVSFNIQRIISANHTTKY